MELRRLFFLSWECRWSDKFKAELKSTFCTIVIVLTIGSGKESSGNQEDFLQQSNSCSILAPSVLTDHTCDLRARLLARLFNPDGSVPSQSLSVFDPLSRECCWRPGLFVSRWVQRGGNAAHGHLEWKEAGVNVALTGARHHWKYVKCCRGEVGRVGTRKCTEQLCSWTRLRGSRTSDRYVHGKTSKCKEHWHGLYISTFLKTVHSAKLNMFVHFFAQTLPWHGLEVKTCKVNNTCVTGPTSSSKGGVVLKVYI